MEDRLNELFLIAPPRLLSTVTAMEVLDRYTLIQKHQKHKGQLPTLFIYPEITSLPFYDKSDPMFASIVRILEDDQNLFKMQQECSRVFRNNNNNNNNSCNNSNENNSGTSTLFDIDTIHSSNYGGIWNSFYFVNQGNIVQNNVNQCPETWAILQQAFGDLLCTGSGIGYVYFSRITPGTHITPHCGVCNMRLRLQLPLSVDQNSQVKIRVADEWHVYKEGEAIIFDDTFNHEVIYQKESNSSGSDGSSVSSTSSSSNSDVDNNISVQLNDRIVLLVDFWHPELTEAEKECTRLLLPPDRVTDQV